MSERDLAKKTMIKPQTIKQIGTWVLYFLILEATSESVLVGASVVSASESTFIGAFIFVFVALIYLRMVSPHPLDITREMYIYRRKMWSTIVFAMFTSLLFFSISKDFFFPFTTSNVDINMVHVVHGGIIGGIVGGYRGVAHRKKFTNGMYCAFTAMILYGIILSTIFSFGLVGPPDFWIISYFVEIIISAILSGLIGGFVGSIISKVVSSLRGAVS